MCVGGEVYAGGRVSVVDEVCVGGEVYAGGGVCV